MALYSLNVSIIGRSNGKSAVASFAYQNRSKGYDDVIQQSYDYRKNKNKCLDSYRVNPLILGNPPDFLSDSDRNLFWQEVQKKENRKNSQFARDFKIALQKELTTEQNKECLNKWILENWAERGLLADVAIHDGHRDKNGVSNENVHAHVMVAMRKLKIDGSWGEKDREANDREFLKQIRKSWADIVNEKFAELGIKERIDERTLEAQKIYRLPQQHQGAIATAMERRGAEPDRKRYENVAVDEKTLRNELKKDPKYTDLLAQLEDQRTENELNQLKNRVLIQPYDIGKQFGAEKNRSEIILRNWHAFAKDNKNEQIQFFRQKNENIQVEQIADRRFDPTDQSFVERVERYKNVSRRFPEQLSKFSVWIMSESKLAKAARKFEKKYRTWLNDRFPKIYAKVYALPKSHEIARSDEIER